MEAIELFVLVDMIVYHAPQNVLPFQSAVEILMCDHPNVT